MTLAIYKATLDTPFGLFLLAVESTQVDARTDLYTAAHTEFNAPHGMIKIRGEVKKSSERLTANMFPIKQTLSDGKYWAWIKRA